MAKWTRQEAKRAVVRAGLLVKDARGNAREAGAGACSDGNGSPHFFLGNQSGRRASEAPSRRGRVAVDASRGGDDLSRQPGEAAASRRLGVLVPLTPSEMSRGGLWPERQRCPQ